MLITLELQVVDPKLVVVDLRVAAGILAPQPGTGPAHYYQITRAGYNGRRTNITGVAKESRKRFAGTSAETEGSRLDSRL
jgi:hypothetical protein